MYGAPAPTPSPSQSIGHFLGQPKTVPPSPMQNVGNSTRERLGENDAPGAAEEGIHKQ
jgi:hypothetical protein